MTSCWHRWLIFQASDDWSNIAAAMCPLLWVSTSSICSEPPDADTALILAARDGNTCVIRPVHCSQKKLKCFGAGWRCKNPSGRAECFDRTCYIPAAFLPLLGRDLTLIRRLFVIISRKKNAFSHGRSIDLPEGIHNSALPSACGINTPKWSGFNIFKQPPIIFCFIRNSKKKTRNSVILLTTIRMCCPLCCESLSAISFCCPAGSSPPFCSKRSGLHRRLMNDASRRRRRKNATPKELRR